MVQFNFVTRDLLFARFDKLAPLNEYERNFLRTVEGRAKQMFRPGDQVLTQRAEIRAPALILSGWAYEGRELANGRRLITNFLLPGDTIGLCLRRQPLALTSVFAVSKLRTVEVPETAMGWRDNTRMPGLFAALDAAADESEHFLLGHLMRLGRQSAYERLAHLFVELEYRLSRRGLATNGSFVFPCSQTLIADAVGLSVVHVNRSLQQMRRGDVIDLTRGRLTLLDMPALLKSSEFTPPASLRVQGASMAKQAPVNVAKGNASTHGMALR